MGTHSVLGVKLPDGSISGCYVHYDGYEEHMVPAIKSYIKKNTTTALYVLIVKAAAVGGIRSFNSPSSGEDTDLKTDFLDDDIPYVIDENNWKEDHCGTHAWYLVDYNTGRIHTRSKHG